MQKESWQNKNLAIAIGSLLLSLTLLIFAQPDLSPIACLLTASVGYALLWKGLEYFNRLFVRFLLSFLIFGAASFVHLSWFASDQYVGGFIFLFLFIWVSFLGAGFALFSLIVCTKKKITIFATLGLAGLWTLSEWARLFILSGYTLDPVGLNLSASLSTLQLASFLEYMA